MTPDAMPLNPFPGLRPFKPDESTLFFGRDDQIGEALERLMRRNCWPLWVCRAVARVRSSSRGWCQRWKWVCRRPQQQWRIEIMRPGDGPLRELRLSGLEAGPWPRALTLCERQ
jgi:hypothetical protein